MDPGMMQQMLMAASQQQPQGAPGGAPQGQTTPLNAAAQLAQKAMLVRALTAPQQQQRQANGMLPQTNAMMGQAPLPQPQMPPMQANPQVAPPFAQPTPGFS
jgi:hypothetical protein